MDKSRRNFIGYVAILGVTSLSGLSLLQESSQDNFISPTKGTDNEYIDVDHESFDPDGWL